MTQENKELLLRDLCTRLPYGVKIYLDDFPNATLVGVVNEGIILHCDKHDYTYDAPWDIEYIKPYLFPLSSMTEEQKKEYQYITERWMYDSSYSISDSVDWLNANHFDFRNLIGRGLAIDCINLNIY